MNRILAFMLSLLSIIIGGYLMLEFQGLGFPDGHLTELELTLQKLYPFYLFLYVIFAGYFLFLGYNGKKSTAYTRPKLAVVSFAVLFILMLFVNGYLSSILDHGGGG